MGELISLQEYKEKKQDNDIASLQAELAELIEQMGVHTVPEVMMSGLDSYQYGLSFSIPDTYKVYNDEKDEE